MHEVPLPNQEKLLLPTQSEPATLSVVPQVKREVLHLVQLESWMRDQEEVVFEEDLVVYLQALPGRASQTTY